METFLTIVVWLLFGVLSANYARYRGRDPYLWFFIGMFMGIFAILLLFFLPAVEKKEENVMEDLVLDRSLPPPLHDFQLRDWYYLDLKREQQGPISFNALKQKWLDGGISSSTLVWSDGMDQWQKIQDLAILKDLLGET